APRPGRCRPCRAAPASRGWCARGACRRRARDPRRRRTRYWSESPASRGPCAILLFQPHSLERLAPRINCRRRLDCSDYRTMGWNDVDAFCCVREHGGCTAAAKALARPKSSISASVSRLEGELGARLLQRTTRRVRATEAGESLYQDAAPMFQRLREVRANAAARGNAVAGRLRIAAPYEFGAHHLGAVACEMLARSPDLRIDIDVEHGRIDPLDRSYDIVFSYFDGDLPDSGRIARNVFALRRGVFAAPALLEKYPKVKTPQDLAELPAIAAPMDAEWSFKDAEGETHAVPIRARMRSP